MNDGIGLSTNLSISVQGREVEEQGLSKRYAVDWVVQVVTPVQLHLDKQSGKVVNLL